MVFDITKIDKKKLLQALYAQALPKGLGVAEYLVRKEEGENVDFLTDEECENILSEFNHCCSEPKSEIFSILDYYKGKPMKIIFKKEKNERILVDSDRYDSRNGQYKFLKAMMSIFPIEDIHITKKDFAPYTKEEMIKYGNTTKEEEVYYKNLLENSIKKENEFGQYWQLVK